MARRRHDQLHIERRRQLVADSYLKGESQAAIAGELSVSQATISSDRRTIRKEWRESRVRDFDEAVAVELKRIDRLEREAWAGWERSQEPLESTKVINDGAEKRAEETVRHQTGDPRYLDQVHRCIASRRALLGLDAPTKIAPTSPDGERTYHAQAMSELMKLAEQSRRGPVVIDGPYIEEEVQRRLEEPKDVEDSSVNEDQHEESTEDYEHE